MLGPQQGCQRARSHLLRPTRFHSEPLAVEVRAISISVPSKQVGPPVNTLCKSGCRPTSQQDCYLKSSSRLRLRPNLRKLKRLLEFAAETGTALAAEKEFWQSKRMGSWKVAGDTHSCRGLVITLLQVPDRNHYLCVSPCQTPANKLVTTKCTERALEGVSQID